MKNDTFMFKIIFQIICVLRKIVLKILRNFKSIKLILKLFFQYVVYVFFFYFITCNESNGENQ